MNNSKLLAVFPAVLVGLLPTIASASTIGTRGNFLTANIPSPVTCKADGLAPNKVCTGSFPGLTWATTGTYILEDSPGVVSDYLVIKNGLGGAVFNFEPATGTPSSPILGTLAEDTSLTLPKLFLLSGSTQVAYVQLVLTQDGGSYPEVLVGNYVPITAPEPATLAVVGLGLAGFALSRRFCGRRLSQ